MLAASATFASVGLQPSRCPSDPPTPLAKDHCTSMLGLRGHHSFPASIVSPCATLLMLVAGENPRYKLHSARQFDPKTHRTYECTDIRSVACGFCTSQKWCRVHRRKVRCDSRWFCRCRCCQRQLLGHTVQILVARSSAVCVVVSDVRTVVPRYIRHHP